MITIPLWLTKDRFSFLLMIQSDSELTHVACGEVWDMLEDLAKRFRPGPVHGLNAEICRVNNGVMQMKFVLLSAVLFYMPSLQLWLSLDAFMDVLDSAEGVIQDRGLRQEAYHCLWDLSLCLGAAWSLQHRRVEGVRELQFCLTPYWPH